MQIFGEGPHVKSSFLIRNFPWASLGAETVIDLGGSNGSVSLAIAEAHPALKFVGQDREETVQAAKEEGIPLESTTRIDFMAHDSSSSRRLPPTFIYNWPDAYAIKILRQLILVPKLGARVVVNDYLLPEPNTLSLMVEREMRCV